MPAHRRRRPVAQLTQMGRERRLPFQAAAGPKRSVAFVAAPRRRRVPSALSLGRVGSAADGALVAAVGVHVMLRRLMGRNNVVPLGNVAPAPAGDDAAQFADVGGRVRARAAPLAYVGKDPRRRACRRRSSPAAARRESGRHPNTDTDTDRARRGGLGDASASPSLAAARPEARLAREAAERRRGTVRLRLGRDARRRRGGDGAGGARARRRRRRAEPP